MIVIKKNLTFLHSVQCGTISYFPDQPTEIVAESWWKVPKDMLSERNINFNVTSEKVEC
jgi:hypothetical protein